MSHVVIGQYCRPLIVYDRDLSIPASPSLHYGKIAVINEHLNAAQSLSGSRR